MPTRIPTGICDANPSLNKEPRSFSTLSIITTKRNNTATAPTYTISIIIPKNSAPIIMNKLETLIKSKIRKKTALTVFLDDMTIIAAKTAMVEKK